MLAVIDRSAPVLSVDHPGRAAVLRLLNRASARVEADGPDELLRTLNTIDDPGATVLTVGRLSTLTAALSSFCTRRSAESWPAFAHMGGMAADDAHGQIGFTDDIAQRCAALERALQAATSRKVPLLRVEATDIAHIRLGFQAASGAAIPVVRAAQSEGALRERLGGAAQVVRQLAASRHDGLGDTTVELDGLVIDAPDYWLLGSRHIRLGRVTLGDAEREGLTAMAGRVDEIRTLLSPTTWLKGTGFKRQTRVTQVASVRTEAPWMLDGWLHVPESRAAVRVLSGGSVALVG